MKKVLNTCEYQWRDFLGDHAKMFIDKKWEIRCPKCLYWTVDHG